MSVLDKLTVKPWLAKQRAVDDLIEDGVAALPAVKVAVWLFLLVVAALFTLLSSAYMMRMEYNDWQTMPEPGLLWFNTVSLVASGIALYWAQISVQGGRAENVRRGIIAGAVFAVVFLIGQFAAWQQLGALGYFAASNPANAFFYLVTGLHGAHLMGGMIALAVTAAKMWNDDGLEQVSASVEMCAVYWHCLLLVWVVMFGLLLSS